MSCIYLETDSFQNKSCPPPPSFSRTTDCRQLHHGNHGNPDTVRLLWDVQQRLVTNGGEGGGGVTFQTVFFVLMRKIFTPEIAPPQLRFKKKGFVKEVQRKGGFICR